MSILFVDDVEASSCIALSSGAAVPSPMSASAPTNMAPPVLPNMAADDAITVCSFSKIHRARNLCSIADLRESGRFGSGPGYILRRGPMKFLLILVH